MDSVIPHVTKLQNGTHVVPLQFLILVNGFAITGLNPGRKQMVDLSKVLRICRQLESASWTIEILINQGSSGLKLTAQHLLDYVVIVFELRRLENGKYILMAKGVREKKIDVILRMGRGIGTILGRDRIWKRRNFEPIAEAPPKYARAIPQLRNRVTGDARHPRLRSKREGRDSLFLEQQHVVQNIDHEDHSNSTHSSDSIDFVYLMPIKREGRDSLFLEQHVVRNIEHEDHSNSTHSTDSIDFFFLFLFALLVIIIFRML